VPHEPPLPRLVGPRRGGPLAGRLAEQLRRRRRRHRRHAPRAARARAGPGPPREELRRRALADPAGPRLRGSTRARGRRAERRRPLNAEEPRMDPTASDAAVPRSMAELYTAARACLLPRRRRLRGRNWDVEDILHDTFLVAQAKIDSFEPAPGLSPDLALTGW